MTVEKAIEEVQFNMSHIGIGARAARRVREAKEMAIEALEKVQQFEAIGTIERFRELNEKAEQKPIRMDLCTCPSCGTHNEVFKKRRNTVTYDIVHCWHCGQAVEIKRD